METMLEITCAWCGKSMGVKDGHGVTGVSHGICEVCSGMTDIETAVRKLESAKAELLKAIREDAKIAENQRDVWHNLQSGSTDWRG